ncbi:hypothetical protein [uncultured Pseudoteredinibacter sp.]|uniref:hypothetical protein n=1 Tax=uncultured Pseudoteredinibacter sp. TaxID=1641701 RepID=UPI00262BA9A4|nr:hypothetical protein [uncultured Pseudoteredinibacter sp.]
MKSSNLEYSRIDSDNSSSSVGLVLIFILLAALSLLAKHQLDGKLSELAPDSSKTHGHSKMTSYLGVIKNLDINRNGQKAKLKLLLLLDQQNNIRKVWTLNCNGDCGANITRDKIASTIQNSISIRGLSLSPPNLELVHSPRNESFNF